MMSDADDWNEMTIEEQAYSMEPSASGAPIAPMGSQREADEQREACGIQWATGQPREKPQWLAVVAAQITDFTIQAFMAVGMSCPCGTELGWDLHPRALGRLPTTVLLQIILCSLAAETIG